LVSLESIDGGVAEFSVYQGKAVKLVWSKLPAAVQAAFAAGRDALLAPPDPAASAKLINGLVLQNIKDGLLVTVDGRTVLLRGYPSQEKMADGNPVRAYAKDDGIYRYEASEGPPASVHAYLFISVYN
jgi:hypothetical protein